MPGPVYLTQPNSVRLPQLLTEIRDGELRIPRFKRPFVWSSEQRLLLFDSIYRAMPIGSILVWRTREHDLRTYSHLGSLPLASRVGPGDSKEVKQYLLDGHQRLTTLYSTLGQALRDENRERSTLRTKNDFQEQGQVDPWVFFFDLENREFSLLTMESSAPPPNWLPLSILFDPFKLYQFQKDLAGRGGSSKLAHRAESLASTFKD